MKLCLILILVLHTLLLQTICQNYADRQNTNPYEIFTAHLNNQLVEKTISINKTLFMSTWSQQAIHYSIKYAHKFDRLVICWHDLQILPKTFSLTHIDRIDPNFIPQIKKKNPNIKILLRIYVLNSAKQIFDNIGSNSKKISDISKAIITTFRSLLTDGIFYDSQFNIPYLPTKDQSNRFQKFAIVINSFIVNRIKDYMQHGELLLYGIKNPWYTGGQIDYTALSNIHADQFVVSSLQNAYYQELAIQALFLVNNMRSVNVNVEYSILLPFFSRRGGIGVRGSQVKLQLERNGVSFRGFKNGVCSFTEAKQHTASFVPCYRYFQKMFQYAQENKVGLAFYEAGLALQKYFQFL